MNQSRSPTDLIRIIKNFSDRDREILAAFEQLRLLSAAQLQRLCFSDIKTPTTRAALARRILGRLHRNGLLGRLERRIGGARRGSAGYVYFLAPRGQRASAYLRGEGAVVIRRQHEPGAAYVAHALAVGECFVHLQEAARLGTLELLAYQGEPDCWRSFASGTGARLYLKPDAAVVVGVGEWEERAFIEVDRATHGRTALRRKAVMYLDYLRAGHEDVVPRVLWIVPTNDRQRILDELFAMLPAPAGDLFVTATTDTAIDALIRAESPTSGGSS